MRILVTGAHGLLGRSLLRQGGGTEIIGCGRRSEPAGKNPYRQIEIVDRTAVVQLLDSVRPDWVIHTAAMTDVDLCETQRNLARQVNLEAVSHLVEACGEVEAGLVQLSTDYVFDGRAGPYGEKDATNPLSHYGALKLESENLVLGTGIKGLVLRTLWLYGYIPGTRRNLVTWPLETLGRGESLSIASDQWGNPTLVEDLARALLELCERGAGGLFHMGGSAYLTRWEMVSHIAHRFGFSQELVRPIATETAPSKARRPLRSGLRNDALAALLGRVPLGFAEGLERMIRDESFRRDFADLV